VMYGRREINRVPAVMVKVYVYITIAKIHEVDCIETSRLIIKHENAYMCADIDPYFLSLNVLLAWFSYSIYCLPSSLFVYLPQPLQVFLRYALTYVAHGIVKQISCAFKNFV
jgi:hypothetical protein